jgi:hypothetical protein
MGFAAGISAWRQFLKPGGKLIVSEITWLCAARPAELQSYWEAEYPEIDVASAKIGILSDKAKTVVEAEQREIAFYEKYRTYYSYGVFVAKKV